MHYEYEQFYLNTVIQGGNIWSATAIDIPRRTIPGYPRYTLRWLTAVNRVSDDPRYEKMHVLAESTILIYNLTARPHIIAPLHHLYLHQVLRLESMKRHFRFTSIHRFYSE